MLKTLKNHREKIIVRVNVRMSKIVRMPIKVGVRMYAPYANCRTLELPFVNCCYFITAATDVIVSVTVGTLLSTLVYLQHSVLPARLVSSGFLIYQLISDCPLSQSFY